MAQPIANPAQDKFLESELSALEIATANFASRFITDSRVRLDYINQTAKFSKELRDNVKKKLITPSAAAQQAQTMRNQIMAAMRGSTSDFGLALARLLKKEGKTLAQLEAKYALQVYKMDFAKLSNTQQGVVWRKIVEKAGQPQLTASNTARWFGRAGRGLFVLTVVISIYHVAKAKDKVRATANEISAIGGGIAGASALGAAGLACGPAAIACVPLGIFVGGVIGSAGADWAFDQIW